jgi:hypothetical protein
VEKCNEFNNKQIYPDFKKKDGLLYSCMGKEPNTKGYAEHRLQRVVIEAKEKKKNMFIYIYAVILLVNRQIFVLT